MNVLAVAIFTLGLLLASVTTTELQGLDGRVFLFNGEEDGTYNLISEQFHQVNALFVEGPLKASDLAGGLPILNGTYIGGMGLKLYDTLVLIDVEVDGSMTVVVDGERVNLTDANNFKVTQTFGDVNITTEKYRTDLGETVQIDTPIYKFVLYASPRVWDQENQVVNRGHLNMMLGIKPDAYFSREVHGILGQIRPDTHPDARALPKELQTAFLGEGEEFDYAVDSLFSDDFKFNRFGVAPEPSPSEKVNTILYTSRRLLRGENSTPQQAWHPARIF